MDDEVDSRSWNSSGIEGKGKRGFVEADGY